jgi:hypothetical protein
VNPVNVLVAYASGLVVVLGASLALGSVVGPAPTPTSTPRPGHTGGDQPHGLHDGPPTGPSEAPSEVDGYSLSILGEAPGAGLSDLVFEITDADDARVTGFTPNHGKDVHLIAVRHDMTGYQHVHPEPVGDGSWTVPLDLAGGTWRLIADVVPEATGTPVAVTTDLEVAGGWTRSPLPVPASEADVDGYTVTMDGSLVAGRARTLTFRIAKDGRPVTDLQPYLEAYGHLVALREGDLAYLHVHPEAHGEGHGEGHDAAAGPDISFAATAPSEATYRLFVDFRHEDVVRTAALTTQADPGADVPAPAVTGDATTDPHGSATHEH